MGLRWKSQALDELARPRLGTQVQPETAEYVLISQGPPTSPGLGGVTFVPGSMGPVGKCTSGSWNFEPPAVTVHTLPSSIFVNRGSEALPVPLVRDPTFYYAWDEEAMDDYIAEYRKVLWKS